MDLPSGLKQYKGSKVSKFHKSEEPPKRKKSVPTIGKDEPWPFKGLVEPDFSKVIPKLADVERKYIDEALKYFNYDVKRSAIALGISKQKLYRYINRHNIDISTKRMERCLEE